MITVVEHKAHHCENPDSNPDYDDLSLSVGKDSRLAYGKGVELDTHFFTSYGLALSITCRSVPSL